MIRRPPRSTRTVTLLPYTTRFRSIGLKLNACIRRTTDKPTLCSTATPAGQPLRTEAGCKIIGQSVKASFSATTWTLGLDWQISRDVFLYVTSRRGYRAGGVNSPALGTALASLQNYTPETITDIEAGLKANGQIAGMPRSEEHTSELQSLMRISYAVFCL